MLNSLLCRVDKASSCLPAPSCSDLSTYGGPYMYVNYYHVIGHSSYLMHRPRPSTVQTMNRWVDMQLTRSGQRAGRERAMGELALNEQQTCGEYKAFSLWNMQKLTRWRHAANYLDRFGRARSQTLDWNVLYLIPLKYFRNQILLDYSGRWRDQYYCTNYFFSHFTRMF